MMKIDKSWQQGRIFGKFAHAFHDENGSKDLRLLLNVDMDEATIGTQGELCVVKSPLP
jgi:hypothetical protein